MATFRNLDTNEIVRVMSEDENFYILDSGQKMDKKLFVQKYVSNDSEPTPVVDISESAIINKPIINKPLVNHSDSVNVDDFFAAKPSIQGTENLKKIDTTNLVDLPPRGQGWIPDNVKDLNTENPSSSTIIQQPQNGMLSIEQQKQILIDNYNAQHQGQKGQQIIGAKPIDINDDVAIEKMMNQVKPPKPPRQLNENGLTLAQENMRQQQIELTGVDPYKDKIIHYRAKMGLDPTPINEPKIIQQPISAGEGLVISNEKEEDEVIKMFKKFKRNHPISIKFSLKDKIGKPEFIQMMAEGLEGDIIQFYTDELFKIFISDIDSIKEDIYNQIYKKVYGVDKPVEIEELIEPQEEVIEEIKEKTTYDLIPGKKTSSGKQKYKFIDTKGKIVELLIETAQKKQYKPATKKDLKK